VAKLYVVRHADAGHRSDWDGPDHTRPLSERGWRQAHGLVDTLGDCGVHRLLASPYTRCIQTLEPLGERLGLAVEPDDRLAEGAGAPGPLALDEELRDVGAVICSHGDVIPDLLEHLVREGVKLHDDLRWQKASTWAFSRDGGRLAKGRYLPPPA
jgi:8-oxo-dGTP diphosphatase